MKSTILISAALFFHTQHTILAQREEPTSYLIDHLPNNLELDTTTPRSYQLITSYYDYDMRSNFLIKRKIFGKITYDNDSAKWQNVYYCESKITDETFPPGEKLDFMQNFTYQPKEEILSAKFFKEKLPQANPYTMNLIWDALCFESLAHWDWDSLQLNKMHQLHNEKTKLNLAIGSFENKDIQITWIGITKINGKTCAILKYSTMNNPLNVTFNEVMMRGRSHYWGEIYVSLSDKQIEYACLTEDILTDVQIKNHVKDIFGYTIRYITLLREK